MPTGPDSLDGTDVAAIVAASRLRDVPDFPQPGVVFKDITPLLADPRAFATVIEALRRRHAGSVDLVAGVEARGFVVGAALAHALGVGFVPVRKAGKLPGETVSISYDLEYGSAEIEVHADAFVGGERVLLVDDVLATGGTAAAAWDLLEQVGADVVGVRVRGRAGLPRWAGPDGVPPGGSAPRRPMTGDYTPGMAEDTTTATGTTPPQVPSSRARARAALALVGRNKVPENPVLEPLLQVVRSTHPKADLSLVERAYAVAERAHDGQKRRSGDDYITHPLAVTTILAELGMTPVTLAAALLHDTVEDTSYSLEALRRDFGDEIAMLVDGVTKLDKVTYGQAAQAETVRKMVVAMARDIRVLVIKLADRLHNARTWRYVSQESAQRKAKETLEIYAPLAHRLGMNTIKWELEDLSFQALYPKVYDEIVRAGGRARPGPRGVPRRRARGGQRRPALGQDQGHRHGSPEALLLRLPEDDRGGPRLRADLRPRRGAGARRDGARLLRGTGGAARAVEPGAGAVQGLHRDAEVQHVPVAAHDGHRPRRQAGRDPDPHPHDAPPGRVRRRRALEVQGGPRRQGHRQPGWRAGARRADRRRQRHGVASPAPRLAEGDVRPG